jgi:hypothetical protein
MPECSLVISHVLNNKGTECRFTSLRTDNAITEKEEELDVARGKERN